MDGKATIGPLPLVGRSDELAAITSSLDAAALGRGIAIEVVGEAGAGKTRLAGIAIDEAARRGWGVATGRAHEIEADLPYGLVADVLLPTVENLSDRVRDAMAGVLDELTVLFPALGRLRQRATPATPLAATADFRNRLLWNFAHFLEDVARVRPLVLVLEDLHWADPSSIELIHFLARRTTKSRVVLVCTYRDDFEPVNAPLRAMEQSLANLGVSRSIRLLPLGRTDVAELVRSVFAVPDEVTASFTTQLYGWTRGNPFFIEETLKSLVEAGRLRQEHGVWVGWDIEELELPPSVRDAVLRRVNLLDAESRDLAELAAVLDMRVQLDVLVAVTGRAAAELAGALDELARRRILVVAGSGDGVAWEFGHPIVRDTLYGGIGQARAGVLHGVVAQALERHYGASATGHAGELAYHYTRAIGADLAGKTVHYLIEAGRRALSTYANPEALKYLTAALVHAERTGSAGQPTQIAGIVELLAHAHQRQGEIEHAATHWRRARAIAEEHGDPASAARVQRRLGLARYWNGDVREALGELNAGLEAAEVAGDNAMRASTLVARGLCLQELGRAEDALADLHTAEDLAQRAGSDRLLATVHRALLLVYLWTGPPSKAREHGATALAFARAADDDVLSFWVNWALAMLGGLNGDSARMTSHLEACQRIARKLRSPLMRIWAAELSVELAFGRGEWDPALAIGEDAIGMARELRQTSLLPRLLVWTAMVHIGRHDLEQARRSIEEAWTLAHAAADPTDAGAPAHGTEAAAAGVGLLMAGANVHSVIAAHIGRAALHLASGQFAEAMTVAENGLSIVDRTGYSIWAVHRLLPTAAEAALQAGDVERAARFGARLRELANHFENRLGLAWADACDALTIWLRGDPARGAELMRLAAARLEAIPFLPDAVRLRRQLAGRLAEIGDREGALHELRQVHETLVRLGAGEELARARDMFREMDARPPTLSPRRGAATLTPREVQIARAVANRMSNKAIAELLDVAVRTVTTHLTSIYRKVGVEGRHELADLVRAADLTGEFSDTGD